MTGLLLIAAAVCAGGGFQRYALEFNAADEELYTNAVPNAAAGEFLAENAPHFECPDETIVRAYSFRWWTFRKHLRKTPSGWVITEFLPNVGWAGKHNTISCPLGHHIREGRWLGGGSFAERHLEFMLDEGNVTGPRSYVNWPARSAMELEAVTGDRAFTDRIYPKLRRHQEAWDAGWVFAKRYFVGLTNGMYAVVDDREGMEMSPSEYAYRPVINSAFAANLVALAEIASRLGRTGEAAGFRARAAELRRNIGERLGNERLGFYTARSPDGRMSGVREECGYAPWYFGAADNRFEGAWRELVDPEGFAAPFGLTTVERRSGSYRISYEGHECQWNGPVWPYATSMTLSALAVYLQGGGEAVPKGTFHRLLKQYAASHRRDAGGGRSVDWIDEVQNPDTGDWISRTMILANEKLRRMFPRERGKDYNHSTFCDLVITGICGFVPRCDGRLEVKPLAPDSWDWWRIDGIRYRGDVISIVYDRTGSRYGLGRGLTVLRNGKPAVISS